MDTSYTNHAMTAKVRVMAWLQEQPSGEAPGDMDTERVAKQINAGVGVTNSVLWRLRRQGLIAFHEKKGNVNGGHGTGVWADRIRLTDAGRGWADGDAAGARREADYVDAILAKGDGRAVEIAAEMMVERAQKPVVPPAPEGGAKADALAWWLKHQPGRVGNGRDFNEWSGRKPTSVFIYQMVERSPEAFELAGKGNVRFIGPDDWRFIPKPARPVAPVVTDKVAQPKVEDFVAGVSTPLLREAEASVALDGDTQSADLTIIGPLLTELLAREARRKKVEDAVALLEAAGLDDDALVIINRIPDDTELEKEILAVLRSLGY